jgi:hypothetical protein
MLKYTFVNPTDMSERCMVMEIAFNYDSEVFVVGGYCEQDCLDFFADFCKEMGYDGAFLDGDEEQEYQENEWDVYYGGNYCHPMDLNRFSITFR